MPILDTSASSSSNNSLWMPSCNLIAQLGHFGWGVLFIVVAALFHHWHYGLIALFAWAAPKEFVFDVFIERDSWADNFEDFGFYCLGGGVGCVIYFLSVLLHSH